MGATRKKRSIFHGWVSVFPNPKSDVVVLTYIPAKGEIVGCFVSTLSAVPYRQLIYTLRD